MSCVLQWEVGTHPSILADMKLFLKLYTFLPAPGPANEPGSQGVGRFIRRGEQHSFKYQLIKKRFYSVINDKLHKTDDKALFMSVPVQVWVVCRSPPWQIQPFCSISILKVQLKICSVWYEKVLVEEYFGDWSDVTKDTDSDDILTELRWENGPAVSIYILISK